MANSVMEPSSPSPEKYSDDPSQGVPKDWRFWTIIFSLALSILLTAIEFTAIGAALPTITHSLKGGQFVWVGSAYALGSSALVPLCGGLSQIIGRRPVLLSAIILFALGSAICGAASSMNMLIAGRAIQGLGAGAITSSVQTLLSDLVTLRERGTFSGLIAFSWVIGGGVGPGLGGLLAQSGNWRWLFYLNLPMCALNAILVLLFLRVKTPPTTLREKLSKIDIIGNILVTGSTASVVIGLTWGGVEYSWSSARVLSALVIGLVGLGVFIIYEIYFCKPPIVPIVLRMNWPCASGYIQNFLMAVVMTAMTYWYPVFFEACKERSPTRAGVDIFGLSFGSSVSAIVTGLTVRKTGKYLIPICFGWIFMAIGAGLLTTLHADSSIAKAVGFQVIIGSGFGTVYVAAIFPILASMPVTLTAPAMGLYVFTRNFGSIWGVTTGGAILQNELKNKLPTSFLTLFPQGVQMAFAAIPVIPLLDQPLKDEVRNTFGFALKVVWQILIGVAIVGLLCNIGMKQLKLHTEVDKDWGTEDLPDDRRWTLRSSLQPKQQISDTIEARSV